MAFITCGFFSEALGQMVEFKTIFPDKRADNVKVLYLLHGLSDDHTCWSRNTAIERYVSSTNALMVVMPNVARSFYTDMKYGRKYYTYVSEELPAFVQRMFNVSGARENTYVAGLSMGGYGAFKLALRNPDKYCAAASFSGVLDVADFVSPPESQRETILVFGENHDFENSLENPIHLLDIIGDVKPKLFQACGTEDFLYQENQKFRNKIEKMDFDYYYTECPGEHTWDFWDKHILMALKHFGLVNEAVK